MSQPFEMPNSVLSHNGVTTTSDKSRSDVYLARVEIAQASLAHRSPATSRAK